MMAPAVLAGSLEVLRVRPETGRAQQSLEALALEAVRRGANVRVSTKHAGDAPWLLLWGPGAPDRQAAMARQTAAGGHVVALDLAYWNREIKVRVSIDAPHPQAWVMRRDWPAERRDADPVRTGSFWDPSGPVIVAGIGAKARIQYGVDATLAWEAAQIADARRRFGRHVLYRRKKATDPLPRGAVLAPELTIDQLLLGASLVITWHSNVAVDAIRLGVPVVCRDGAAAAVCPSTLDAEHLPLASELRTRFLDNLAWFQWAPSEARDCWSWIQDLVTSCA